MTPFSFPSPWLNFAIEDASRKGFSIDDREISFQFSGGVGYEETKRVTLDAFKTMPFGRDKIQRLHISLYRMETGRYELTHYLN